MEIYKYKKCEFNRIRNKIVHPLYSILIFIDRTSKKKFYKDDINLIGKLNLDESGRGSRNIWFNILGDSIFFIKSKEKGKLSLNKEIYRIKHILNRCNKSILDDDV